MKPSGAMVYRIEKGANAIPTAWSDAACLLFAAFNAVAWPALFYLILAP
jgi:hypothetical protein